MSKTDRINRALEDAMPKLAEKGLIAVLEVDDRVDRGAYLGGLYIARRNCGKVSAMCWDDPGSERDTAKSVAMYIRRGDMVERVERYENDPQPEWICRSGCTDCTEYNGQSQKERPSGMETNCRG